MAKQEKLIERTEKEIQELKIRLANVTLEYKVLEDEKRERMKDYNARLKELWEEVEKMEQALNE